MCPTQCKLFHPILQRQWQPQHRWISSKATGASEPQPITWDKWMSQTYRNKHRFFQNPPLFFLANSCHSPRCCAQTQIFAYHLPLKGLRFKLRWSFRDAQPGHFHHRSTVKAVSLEHLIWESLHLTPPGCPKFDEMKLWFQSAERKNWANWSLVRLVRETSSRLFHVCCLCNHSFEVLQQKCPPVPSAMPKMPPFQLQLH